jgi:hypothetical protein
MGSKFTQVMDGEFKKKFWPESICRLFTCAIQKHFFLKKYIRGHLYKTKSLFKTFKSLHLFEKIGHVHNFNLRSVSLSLYCLSKGNERRADEHLLATCCQI